MTSAIVDIQRQQDETKPRDDLRDYAGEWVALRDGRVVASNIDAVALRNDPKVRSSDDLLQVPPAGTQILIL